MAAGPDLTSPAGRLPQEGLRRRIQALMAARLLLALAAFGLALAAVGVGREGAAIAERGLYATLAAAFAASLVSACAFRFVQRLRLLALVQLGTDVALVSALVLFSGGTDSIFGFLYLPLAVYGAVLFERRGAYGAAVACAVAHAGALFLAERLGLGLLTGLPRTVPIFAHWVAHTGGLLLVALLASTLVRELRAAGAALRERTHEVGELRRLNARIFDCLTSGLVTTDAEGRITALNPEAQRIVGCSEVEASERPLEALLPGASELVAEVASGASRVRRRLPFRGRDGVDRHLGLAASLLRDEHGAAAGHVVIFQDVTDVVRMEQLLRRNERLAAAGELSAHLAHEIRNPLAAISGGVEMLTDGRVAEAGERNRLTSIVLREVERLDRLLGDFLAYARPGPPQPRAVELRPLVEEVLEMFAAAEPAGIELETAVPNGLCAHADPRQLRQLLWNLVLNAAQAMPDGGALQVAAAAAPQEAAPADRNGEVEKGAWVEITVADAGVGIPAEDLERIFDPFFTTRRGGTGLGLAHVHRVVEAGGGVLDVESEVGKGTRIHVRLPVHDPRASASGEPQEPEAPA